MTILAQYVQPLDTPSGAGTYAAGFTLTLLRQDPVANHSVIGWSLGISKLNSGTGRWSTETNTWYVHIAGNVVASGNFQYDFRNYNYVTISTGSTVVNHQPDGSLLLPGYAVWNDEAANLQAFAIGTSLPTIPVTSLSRATIPTVSPSPAVENGSVEIGLPRTDASFTHDVTWASGSSSV